MLDFTGILLQNTFLHNKKKAFECFHLRENEQEIVSVFKPCPQFHR